MFRKLTWAPIGAPIGAAILAVTLCGCGGRAAMPVSLVRDVDPQLGCEHLQAEYDNNARRSIELSGESAAKVGDNLGLLLVSPLFLDLSDTQKVELKALIARNERLETLAAGKGCPPLKATVAMAKPQD